MNLSSSLSNVPFDKQLDEPHSLSSASRLGFAVHFVPVRRPSLPQGYFPVTNVLSVHEPVGPQHLNFELMAYYLLGKFALHILGAECVTWD